MSYNDRRRRPALPRQEEDRSFSTLFNPPRGDRNGAADSRTNGNGAQSLGNVVAHSVDLGYRIVDDYIRQGEKVARQFSERSATPQTMVNDAQDVALRFAQHASGLAAVWLEFLQLTAANSGVPFRPNFWDAFTPGGAAVAPPSFHPQPASGSPTRAATPERASVRIEIVACQPADVVLDLQPHAAGRPLSVHVLREKDSDSVRITDVAFQPETDQAPACVRIRIPEGQQAGTYNGLIVDDASGRPVGSVSVSLSGASVSGAT